jgi:stage II sporulation protein D (peptidoglycan lytic transglycosylase)
LIRRIAPLVAFATVATSDTLSTRSSIGHLEPATDQVIRVLITGTASTSRVSAPAGFILLDRDNAIAARPERNQVWRMERSAGRVRAVRPDGVPTVWKDALRARPAGDGLLSIDGKPYRGEILFTASDSGLAVINSLAMDDYLMGVVPLEMGLRPASDSAAVQAQAVTARSYAHTHLTPNRAYDVTAGTLDQLYGGVAAENAVASQAVEATRGLVLRYGGRIVNAPYHSTCGGSTAASSEVWRSEDEPYLRQVSDRIPGTERFYCDLAPRFSWTRRFDARTLNAAVSQYLGRYANVPSTGAGMVHGITIASHTLSGRVGTITVNTDRGNYVLRGNDIRYVLRAPGDEILNSTYFSLDQSSASDGSLVQLVIRGFGYGHGVGMCQWGAIGRARAGQDFRAILRAYYPGTSVGPAS